MPCCGGGSDAVGDGDRDAARVNSIVRASLPCGALRPRAAPLSACVRRAQIEKQVKADHAKEKKVVKMLLLGAGESGKSTIFKQMKIINQARAGCAVCRGPKAAPSCARALAQDGFSEEERKNFAPIIRHNVVANVEALIGAFDKLGLDLPDDLGEMHRELRDHASDGPELDVQLIGRMWGNARVQAVYARRNEFQLSDSAAYFFGEIERVGSAAYLPTEDDVLRSRVRTMGIVQMRFQIKGLEFAMFDVGGQRNERRKWIHMFDEVDGVIFVAALSEYDQVLAEDEDRNRMAESIDLFDQIVNSKWFAQTSMILFLNKKDLLAEKVHKSPVRDHFPEYAGKDADYEGALKFFRAQFVAKRKRAQTVIFTHATCATDTSNVSFVFNAVVAIILDRNMAASGLV